MKAKVSSKKVWIYDFQTQSWEETTSLNEERHYVSCGTARNSDGTLEIVVTGGPNLGLKSFEIFDPVTKIWRYDKEIKS